MHIRAFGIRATIVLRDKLSPEKCTAKQKVWEPLIYSVKL